LTTLAATGPVIVGSPQGGAGSQKKERYDQQEGDFVRDGHKGNYTRFYSKGELADGLDEKRVFIQLWGIGLDEIEPTQNFHAGTALLPWN